MSRLKALFDIDRLSILQRVTGGMCIILLLLVGLSVNSWRTINEAYQQADNVDVSVAEAAALSQLAARVGETSTKVTQYALSESDVDLRAAQRALDQLQQQITEVTAAYVQAGSDSNAVDELRGLADRYRNSVSKTIDAIKARRANGAGLVQAATELSTTVAAIAETLAHDAGNPGALDDAIKLVEVFHGSNASATRFLASRNPADSDTTQVDVQAMRSALQALQARNIDNRRVQRFLNAMAEPFDRYVKAVNGLIAATEQFARVATDRNSAATALIEAADQIRLRAAEIQLGTVGAMMLNVTSARRVVYFAAVFAIIAGLILAFLIGRSIARPIRQITEVMRKLAYDTVDVVIPYTSHHNEIGAMAAAVQVFRDNKIEADRLSNENEMERKNKEQRAKSLDALNKGFESTAAALTSTLSSAAASLKQSAEVMFERTEEAGQRSELVKAAAQQACASIESVAGAVEELSTSIDGISDSATRSSSLSAKTAEGARSSDQAVHDLVEDAREIGRVINLIKEIAQQTNLLALNATIEAARAGQAGRGFAVVASEVKALAAQTGAATEDIEAQISRIQSVTTNVVTAIQDIVAQIGQMNLIATSVAAAVDQQRGVARVIAQNAQQALLSAVEAVRAMASIEDASAATQSEANRVLEAAYNLSRQSDDLHGEFDKFIVGVRSA